MTAISRMRKFLLLLISLPVIVVLLFVGLAMREEASPIPIPERPNAWPLYSQGAPPLAGAADQENWGQAESVTVAHNVTEPTLEPFLPDAARRPVQRS